MLKELVANPEAVMGYLIVLGQVLLTMLVAVSWLVGWVRQPDPGQRLYLVLMALGRLSAITFRDAGGSSKWPFGKHPPTADNAPETVTSIPTGRQALPPKPADSEPPPTPPPIVLVLLFIVGTAAACTGFNQQAGKALIAADQATTTMIRTLNDTDLGRQQRLLTPMDRSGSMEAVISSVERYRSERGQLLVRLSDAAALSALGHAVAGVQSASTAWAAQCGQLLGEHPNVQLVCPGNMPEILVALAAALQVARVHFRVFDGNFPAQTAVSEHRTPGAPVLPQSPGAPVPPTPGAPVLPQSPGAPVPPTPGAPTATALGWLLASRRYSTEGRLV